MAGLEATSCGARAAGAPVQPVPRADLKVPAAGVPGQRPACLLLLEDAPARRGLHRLLAWSFGACSAARCNSHADQLSPRGRPALDSGFCLLLPLGFAFSPPVEFPGASAPAHPGPQQGPHLWVERLGCASCAWRGSVAPSVSTASPLRGLVCVSSRSCALSPLTQRLHS